MGYVSGFSGALKCVEYFIKKYCQPHKTQDTYCLRWKKRTNNRSVTAKQMVNKLIARKSVCADCDAKKLVFVKGYKPDKKNSFHKLQKHADLL